jgi:hypothetical protein
MNRLSKLHNCGPHTSIGLTSKFTDAVVFWLISIQVVSVIVYTQNGATTRTLFIVAVIHL